MVATGPPRSFVPCRRLRAPVAELRSDEKLATPVADIRPLGPVLKLVSVCDGVRGPYVGVVEPLRLPHGEAEGRGDPCLLRPGQAPGQLDRNPQDARVRPLLRKQVSALDPEIEVAQRGHLAPDRQP